MAPNCGVYPITLNKEIAPGIYDFRFLAPKMAAVASPGQFVHVACGGDTLLRRPISLCDVIGDELRIVYEVRGTGTRELAKLPQGGTVDVLGPLGHGFDLGDTSRRALFVGGGIGVFPLLMAARPFGNRAQVALGFRSSRQVMLTDEFAAAGAQVFVTTDDGSLGRKCFAPEVAGECVVTQRPDVIFACGPKPMLKAVATLAKEQGIPAQVSMEERMGCGVGACLVCACKVQRETGDHFAHVCKDGPVFDAAEVVFE